MRSDSDDRSRGQGLPFERVRRITGYLVGTMDHWNNAKRAEEHDRVKHDVQYHRGPVHHGAHKFRG